VRLGWASSRRSASGLIDDGRVHVNGQRYRKGGLVGANDHVEVIPAAATPITAFPESKVTLEILYEDAELLIVNKPPLLPCHPNGPHGEASVITLLACDCPEVAELGAKPFEGGLVHRLDNGTSGAVMVARTAEALSFMREALSVGRIHRRYEALIHGRLDESIELTWPVAHHRKNPARMVIVDNAPRLALASRSERIVRAPHRGKPREAISHVEPVALAGEFMLVNVIPRSGCRHQIRVHLAGCGMPIANDQLYGGPPLPPLESGRFWLHLAELAFDSPSGNRVKVTAPRPADLEDALANATTSPDGVTDERKLHGSSGQGLPQRSRITTSPSGLRRTPPNLSRG
jgi:23S rRNA pseudouridine1911/1915/1917 synthase